MTCASCKGLGCSVCQTMTINGITLSPAHVCPECLRGLPCKVSTTDLEWKASQPSLSAAIGAVIERESRSKDSRSSELM